MIVFEKAKELAKLIEQSEELDNLKRLELAVESDIKAINLTKRYGDLYNEIVVAIRDRDDVLIEELKTSMSAALNDIKEYEPTRDLFEAKEKFDEVINTVNEIINHSITGGHEGCGNGGCSSCNECN